jgi:hypothetical protein
MSNTTVNTVPGEFTILGITLTPQVPATAADWDAIAGAGSCVGAAIDAHGWRGYASPVRTAIFKALEAAGHKRNDGEKDAAFIARLTASGVDVEGLTRSAAEGVDFCATIVAGGSRAEVGKDFIQQAEAVVAKIEAGQATLEDFLTKMRTLVPSANVGSTEDVTGIAKVIRAYRKAKDAQDLF